MIVCARARVFVYVYMRCAQSDQRAAGSYDSDQCATAVALPPTSRELGTAFVERGADQTLIAPLGKADGRERCTIEKNALGWVRGDCRAS